MEGLGRIGMAAHRCKLGLAVLAVMFCVAFASPCQAFAAEYGDGYTDIGRSRPRIVNDAGDYWKVSLSGAMVSIRNASDAPGKVIVFDLVDKSSGVPVSVPAAVSAHNFLFQVADASGAYSTHFRQQPEGTPPHVLSDGTPVYIGCLPGRFLCPSDSLGNYRAGFNDFSVYVRKADFPDMADAAAVKSNFSFVFYMESAEVTASKPAITAEDGFVALAQNADGSWLSQQAAEDLVYPSAEPDPGPGTDPGNPDPDNPDNPDPDNPNPDDPDPGPSMDSELSDRMDRFLALATVQVEQQHYTNAVLSFGMGLMVAFMIVVGWRAV